MRGYRSHSSRSHGTRRRGNRPVSAMTTTAAMYGARDGTVNLGRTDEHVLGRWQDARTDDTAALERALRPHASTYP
ncbi:hypothetical protein JM78_23585 [Burkholderia pyrrocinia]|nr:hypothetical protein JM78_23585 [Burkholderia pyrrocinia]